METKVQFKVSKSDLQKHLIMVSKSVKDKSTLPVYTYFLFELVDNNLQLTGTDTNIQIESSLPVMESSGNMQFCADKSIMDILKTLPEQPIDMEVTRSEDLEGNIKIVRVNINITHSSGNINICGDDTEFYKKMKDVSGKSFEMGVLNLKRGLTKTEKFAETDTSKPIVASVYFDIKPESLTFASTDNKVVARMIDYSVKAADADSFILDINSVNILSSLLDRTAEEMVRISSNANNVSFKIGETKLTSRLVEGKYLNYSRVFTDGLSISLICDSKYLSNVVNRLLSVTDKASTLIRLESGLMQTHLLAKDITFNKSADESIECESNGEITIGIHGKQLLDILSVISDNVVLSFSDPQKPIYVTPQTQDENTELKFLFMPVLI